MRKFFSIFLKQSKTNCAECNKPLPVNSYKDRESEVCGLKCLEIRRLKKSAGMQSHWLIGAILLLMMFVTIPNKASAADWDVNKTIANTNFLVTDGGGLCSGTLISLKYKLVLTNHHCVESAISIKEKEETNEDGEVRKVKREEFTDITLTQKVYQDFRLVGEASYKATIVAHERKMDLALLQIRADTIPMTEASKMLPPEGKVVRGEQVWVVGNPRGLDASLSRGIISSTTRMIRASWTENAEVPFFQSDAAINPGNSGGSMYNAEGYLIGVPAATGGSGLGLAIPYQLIRKMLDSVCYKSVYDANADDHEKCLSDKKAKAEAKKK